MAADEAIFDKGQYETDDYVATADISAGEVVLLGNTAGLTIGIAHHAIANGARGSLAINGGIYAVVNLNNAANYTKVYWDNAANKVTTTSTSNGQFGYVTRGGGGGANSTCYARHFPFA